MLIRAPSRCQYLSPHSTPAQRGLKPGPRLPGSRLPSALRLQKQREVKGTPQPLPTAQRGSGQFFPREALVSETVETRRVQTPPGRGDWAPASQRPGGRVGEGTLQGPRAERGADPTRSWPVLILGEYLCLRRQEQLAAPRHQPPPRNGLEIHPASLPSPPGLLNQTRRGGPASHPSMLMDKEQPTQFIGLPPARALPIQPPRGGPLCVPLL